MSSEDHPAAGSSGMQSNVVFGFEDFWSKVYAEHKKLFDAIGNLICLGNRMIETAETGNNGPVKHVICALTRATMAGASEVIVLCGNGCGAGAMKIVRGMYESRWMAEYLRRHPDEVEDYLEFSKVLLWRKVSWLKKLSPGQASRVSAEGAKKIEDDFNQVKARFTDGKGRLKSSWSKKSIREMAKDIGQEETYNLPYAIACSIHHANFEGLLTNFAFDDETPTPDPPPSRVWVGKALTAAWASLWFALNTLNKACNLDYSQKLEAAQTELTGTGN